MHYLHQNLPFDELVALYLAADVMLVTPFRDGMNLVAKEYVAVPHRPHRPAGAERVRRRGGGAARRVPRQPPRPRRASRRRSAPRSTPTTRRVRRRMARLRRQVVRRDVFEWADGFLAALDGGSDLVDEVGDRPDDEVRLDGADAGLLGRRDAG